MTITVSTMFIPVHDPDAALGFYRDALGLEVRLDVAREGFRWVTVGAPGQDVGIVLFQPHGGRSQADVGTDAEWPGISRQTGDPSILSRSWSAATVPCSDAGFHPASGY